jgi:hypothetical protein
VADFLSGVAQTGSARLSSEGRDPEPSMWVPGILAHLPIAVQVNFIPGGCLLNICINHSFCDGLEEAKIVGAWAQKCKELQQVTDVDNTVYNDPQIDTIKNPFQSFYIPEELQDNVTLKDDDEANAILRDAFLWKLLGLRKTPDASTTVFLNLETAHNQNLNPLVRFLRKKIR